MWPLRPVELLLPVLPTAAFELLAAFEEHPLRVRELVLTLPGGNHLLFREIGLSFHKPESERLQRLHAAPSSLPQSARLFTQ